MTLARTRTLATPLRSPDHARSQPFSPGGPSLAATPSARANTAPPVEVKPDFSDLAIVGAGDELLSNPALGPADSIGPSLNVLPQEVEFLHHNLESLTRREREVVFAICQGGTNDEVAGRLCIALPTLRTHLMRLNQKLGSTSKGDVVRWVAAALLTGYRSGSLRMPTHSN